MIKMIKSFKASKGGISAKPTFTASHLYFKNFFKLLRKGTKTSKHIYHITPITSGMHIREKYLNWLLVKAKHIPKH